MAMNMKDGMLFLFPLSGMAFADDGITSEMQVLMTGTWKHPKYGEIKVTEEDIDTMIANFAASSAKELCVDYQHMSSSEDHSKAVAAGWTKSLSKRENKKEKRIELWAKTEWTETAAERIKKKEYKYISPEFISNYKNPTTGKKQGATLLASALTNRPFLKGMSPIVLCEEVLEDLQKDNIAHLIENTDGNKFKEEGLHEYAQKIRHAYDKHYPRCNHMEPYRWIKETFPWEEPPFIIVETGDELLKTTYEIKDDDVIFGDSVEVELEKNYREKKTLSTEGGEEMDRKLLCEQLGLAETATDEDITAELKRLKEVQGNKALTESLGLTGQPTEQEVLDAVKKLKEAGSQTAAEGTVNLVEFNQLKQDHAENKKLTESLVKEKDALNLKLLEKDRDEVIGKALAEFKILPKAKEIWVERFMADPVNTRKLIDTLEPVLDLEEHGSGGNAATGSAGEQLSIKCSEKMAADPKLSQSEAFNLVQIENVDLAKEYAKECGV